MSSYIIPTPSGQNEPKTHTLMPSGETSLEVVLATDKDPDGQPLVTRAGDPRIKVKVMNAEGQAFYHFLYLTDKAFPMVWEFLHALGIKVEGDEFSLSPEILVGKKFQAMVYEDDGWNRLRKPRPVSTEEQATPDPAIEQRPEPTDDLPF